MVYQLPKRLPEELLVSGKTYKRVGGAASVTRGVCKGNDGSWHYYFNKAAVESAVNEIGSRRHFSVCTANGKRSVHISMKPQGATTFKAAKPDEILIWYRFEEQWTGNKKEAEGWGRTAFYGKDAVRVAKAVTLLRTFLEAMTAQAEGGTGGLVTPVLSPPISTFTIEDIDAAEQAFEASQRKPVVIATQSSGPETDDWEDLVK
jgi:hypothetical protein